MNSLQAHQKYSRCVDVLAHLWGILPSEVESRQLLGSDVMRMIRMFSRSPDRWLFEYACSDEVGAASDYLDKRNDAIKRIQRAIADNTADMIKYDSAAAEAELSGDDSMGMSLRKLHKESQDTAQYFKIKLEQLTNGENG